MFAPRDHNQGKEPRRAKPKLTDLALSKKPSSENNPVWQSLALNSATLQPKLAVSQPDDPYEREADHIADRVMRMALPPSINNKLSFASSASFKAQRKCGACEDEEEKKVQRKEQGSSADSTAPAPPIVYEALSSIGKPLDSATRGFFEPRFGHDFSEVRVHADAKAASAARMVEARAYTVGSDIVFGSGEYAPATAEGNKLLAHELAHVVQQHTDEAEPSHIQRAPSTGTQAMHDDLVEQYRRANNLPPHGIDPISGQRVGPSDSEIRFGGLLDAWLSGYQVPAPSQAPSIVAPGTTSVVAICQSAPDRTACLQHKTYVLNILPQAITNIRSVSSPYSTAIADLYTAALAQAQAAATPTPANPSVRATGGPVTVTFGSTTHTFSQFTINLIQRQNGPNGQAFGAGGPIASIDLNELSGDALLRNLSGIEATMVHETMHIFMEIVENQNRTRAPGTPVINRNLDRTSYTALQATLQSALLPFINQIRQLPSFATRPPNTTAQQDAQVTASVFLSEAIARAEAGIFEKQRAGQAFAAPDLHTLPIFIRSEAYWNPSPPVQQELTTFLQTNRTQIETVIQPIILQIGERYLSLRPR
jgi:hypothetical protein